MFERRGLIIHPEEWQDNTLVRLGSARLNVLGLHPRGGARARDSLEAACRLHDTSEHRARIQAAQSHGIAVEYEMHALSWLLPREMFAQEPRWFRMNRNGERTPEYNLCPSRSEALSYLTERVATLARRLDTGSGRFYLWMDDIRQGACQCPECKRWTASEQQLRVVNAMLRGLRKVRPDALLAYLAYQDTMQVPRSIEPEDGVFLEYAPIDRDSTRALDDAACEQNAGELSHLYELIACFGLRNAQVLEYWMDNSRFSGWKTPPKPFRLQEEVMRRDVALYDHLGFSSVTSFACFLGSDYEALHGRPPLERYGEILLGR